MKNTEYSYKYFSNRACRYYPCHQNADPNSFNCLFCYCPLYMLGEDCGGNFTYTEKGYKDCSGCLRPHTQDSFEYITNRFPEIIIAMEKANIGKIIR